MTPELVGVRTWGRPARRSVTVAELLAQLGVALTQNDVERGVALGLVELDGDRVLVDDRFLDVGGRLVRLGLPVSVVLDEWERLSNDAHAIARRFADLFERHLLSDTAALPEIARVLDELGPLAQDVTRLALERALADEADRFAGEHGAGRP